MPDENRSIDILGIKPVAKAIEIAAKGTVDGTGAFLSRICLPAAEEFGLLLKDRVSGWRQNQAASILKKAERNLNNRSNSAPLHAHPRLVMLTIEQGSWNDSDEVQEAWAGLLASSCDESGQSQDNLIFMNLLSQMTTLEVGLLNYICLNAPKYQSALGLSVSDRFLTTVEELFKISGITDIHSLDLQLDHLREIGLMAQNAGIDLNSRDVNLEPSPLALNLYVRAQGSIKSVNEFFGPLEPLPPHINSNFEHLLANSDNNNSDNPS